MSLTAEQIDAFRRDGVLVAENVLTDADVAPVIAAYEDWIDQRARQLHAEGKISDLAENEPWDKRIGLLMAQSPAIANGMDIMHARLPAMFDFLHNEHLLDAVQSLLGTPEITCNPIQHIRAKPPADVSGTGSNFYNVPWHQDSGVTWDEADHSDIITCWMPLGVDATVEMGCMEVLPRVFQRGHLTHQAGEGGATIKPDLLPADVPPRPVPVRKGGVIFMSRFTPHHSTPNLSDRVRWSLDLRYQPTGQPTGRPFHPAFVARSQAHSESVLTDHAEWSRLWAEALEKAKGINAHRVK
jgi:ectoine hydroxylase-related dioxygenase (phytanoyl-CoA dioxygenase family)